jgi:hypothetical protein
MRIDGEGLVLAAERSRFRIRLRIFGLTMTTEISQSCSTASSGSFGEDGPDGQRPPARPYFDV